MKLLDINSKRLTLLSCSDLTRACLATVSGAAPACCLPACLALPLPDPKGPRDERHGSVKLPDTCLAKIMACLAGSLEPGGLRGPSCVANDLAQAALVSDVCCWHDMFWTMADSNS